MSSVLKPMISSYQHLLQDSTQFRRPLQDVSVGARDIIMKADVAEFVMSGSHREIATDVSSLVEGALREF